MRKNLQIIQAYVEKEKPGGTLDENCKGSYKYETFLYVDSSHSCP